MKKLIHTVENNMGSINALVWDGLELSFIDYISGVEIEKADLSDIKKAAEWYRLNKKDFSYSKVLGANTYIGCEVIVGKSRKVKNKVAYNVVDYKDAHYDSFYGNRVSSMVKVENEETSPTWINASCIVRVAKGALPYWAN
mgnify:FL=1